MKKDKKIKKRQSKKNNSVQINDHFGDFANQLVDNCNLKPLKVDFSYLKRRRAEEDQLRKLQLKSFKKQSSKTNGNIGFDTESSLITIGNIKIKIPQNTDMEMLCKVILKNKKATLKKWSWDEILEEWGETPEEVGWRKTYHAGIGVNEKIARKTAIEDFLIVTTKTIQVNPKYLPK